MIEVLESIGLSRNESKTYVSLLELGFVSAGKIAKKAKLDRANIYDSLNKLKEKGLVSIVLRNGIKCFEAANPENLRAILKEKETGLNSILPQLKLRKKLSEDKSETQTYEGLKAFKNLLNNFLEYEEQILVFGIPRQAPEQMRFYTSHFHKKRIPKKIVMKHLYNFNAKERVNYLNKLSYTEARYLPKEIESPVSTNICRDEVVMVLWENKPIIIRIKNKKIADIYKKYFEVLWRIGNE